MSCVCLSLSVWWINPGGTSSYFDYLALEKVLLPFRICSWKFLAYTNPRIIRISQSKRCCRLLNVTRTARWKSHVCNSKNQRSIVILIWRWTIQYLCLKKILKLNNKTFALKLIRLRKRWSPNNAIVKVLGSAFRFSPWDPPEYYALSFRVEA